LAPLQMAFHDGACRQSARNLIFPYHFLPRLCSITDQQPRRGTFPCRPLRAFSTQRRSPTVSDSPSNDRPPTGPPSPTVQKTLMSGGPQPPAQGLPSDTAGAPPNDSLTTAVPGVPDATVDLSEGTLVRPDLGTSTDPGSISSALSAEDQSPRLDSGNDQSAQLTLSKVHEGDSPPGPEVVPVNSSSGRPIPPEPWAGTQSLLPATIDSVPYHSSPQ